AGLSDGASSGQQNGGPVVRRNRLPRSRSVLEGVLDLLAGLLEVGLRLVVAALALQVLVARGAADAFLRLACDVLHLVLGLVVGAHRVSCVEPSDEWTGNLPAWFVPKRAEFFRALAHREL